MCCYCRVFPLTGLKGRAPISLSVCFFITTKIVAIHNILHKLHICDTVGIIVNIAVSPELKIVIVPIKCE